MTRKIDHIVWAGSDLDALRNTFTAMTGIEATPGGRHPTMGTHNALVSLSGDAYLELLAADAQGQTSQNMGGQLAGFASPQVFAFMLKASDLEDIQACLAKEGIAADLIAASRTTPEGNTLTWRLLIPRDARWASFLPVFIDWMDTPHPSATAPTGCTFHRLRIHHPQAPRLKALFEQLHCPIEVVQADTPDIELSFASPKGTHVLHGSGQPMAL